LSEDPVDSLWRTARRLRGAGRLPPLLFFTDPERTPSPEAVMRRLPPGAGVVFRAFGRPEVVAQGPLLRALARSCGLVFLVGGDPALARRLRADGLHLPERDIPVCLVRRAWPRAFIVTAAAHSPLAIRRAERAGVDAIVVSPAFASASPSAGPPLGTTRLASWVRAAKRPIYALGGVNAHTAKRLLGTGVRGLAAVDGLNP